MNSKQNEITLKPYTHKELAVLYDVSWLTLQRWLKPFVEDIGQKNGHFYNTRQVGVIFEKLGWPGSELSE